MSGVAGVTSKRQNIELARYHENDTILSTRREINDKAQIMRQDSRPSYEQPSRFETSRPSLDIKKPELVSAPAITKEKEQPRTLEQMKDLLRFNNELDKRVIGNLKGDHIQDGTKPVFYGREERVTPLQMSARQVLH